MTARRQQARKSRQPQPRRRRRRPNRRLSERREPEGRRFARALGNANSPFVLETGQAAEIVLDAIARSEGTRASVLRELRKTRVRDGILGDFRFDANGDITPTSVPVLRITGATPPGARMPESFQGSVVDRVIEVPPSMVE